MGQKGGLVTMCWHTEFITGNDKEKLINVYNDEKTVTLEKVPKF